MCRLYCPTCLPWSSLDVTQPLSSHPVRFSPISSVWHRTPESVSAGLAVGFRSESSVQQAARSCDMRGKVRYCSTYRGKMLLRP